MEPEIGRYFEGRLYDTTKVLKALYDLGLGAGGDASAWLDGRELVFGRGEPGHGRGFMRVIAREASVIVAFPAGSQIMDPKKRAKGPPGSQTSMVVTHYSELDTYFRRMLESAYALEEEF